MGPARQPSDACRHLSRAAGIAALCLAWPTTAGADLVTLANGRTMSVRAVRTEGDETVLTLRGGGEIRCPSTLVAAVTADEVPADPAAVADTMPRDAAGGAPPPDLSTRPFAPLIATLAARYGLDPRLVHAVVQVESGYARGARSPKGARGLMQVMPATGRQYGVRDLYDPSANLAAGMRHLKSLLSRFDVPLALAAYNAGEASVRRFGGIPPYIETQDYVRRVLRLAGLGGPPPPATPALATPAGQE